MKKIEGILVGNHGWTNGGDVEGIGFEGDCSATDGLTGFCQQLTINTHFWEASPQNRARQGSVFSELDGGSSSYV